ncbi:MAG: hypothetical protein ACJAXK_003335 [Yoonia sp.]|jgi:hypothetical protein
MRLSGRNLSLLKVFDAVVRALCKGTLLEAGRARNKRRRLTMSVVRTQAIAAIKSDTSKSQISDDHFGGRNGSNVFYEKRPSERVTQSTPLPQIKGMTGR